MAHGLPCAISELWLTSSTLSMDAKHLWPRRRSYSAAKAVQLYRDDALWLRVREGANSMIDRRFTRKAMMRRFWGSSECCQATSLDSGRMHG